MKELKEIAVMFVVKAHTVQWNPVKELKGDVRIDLIMPADVRVESGEGIERNPPFLYHLLLTHKLWNPVKELKAVQADLERITEPRVVESGEGIERKI